VLVFATSDKGGTGRSVTSANIVYRAALDGANACYLDFDFGSPTAGAIFHLGDYSRGAQGGIGMHSYLVDGGANPASVNIWDRSDRAGLRGRPRGAGRLTLYPGDEGRGEFGSSAAVVDRCARLLGRLDEEYDLCLVDLSAGRSFATDIVLEAMQTARLEATDARWLVFHRWTRQHIIAANGLVYGAGGILANGEQRGHDRTTLERSLRFVRTAYVDPDSPSLDGLRTEQIAWLHNLNRELHVLAGDHGLGQTTMLGSVPLDPVLQWREQLLLNEDTHRKVANEATVAAFEELARQVRKDAWETL